jgi:UDP-N-acetyl-D-glucosamine/UDP-N-acetyl-D-galactosamine dehydrogenase
MLNTPKMQRNEILKAENIDTHFVPKSLKELKLAIIGLGYVGLPLAIEFGKVREVIGYDINKTRIQELQIGKDRTLETSSEEIKSAKFLSLTDDFNLLARCNCYIVAVPTPIDKDKKPDLSMLINSSKAVGGVLNHGNIVIYESTVYPGCTEEDCAPILEKFSGLEYLKESLSDKRNTKKGFFLGYSPERINPGDKNYKITSIKKVTSGSTNEISTLIDGLYNEIITAGTYKAQSIRVAEAAKVIENTQRDLNIALMNELSILFNKMGIDTQEVLDAAGSKWNFIPFKPGLVGGHCIGVDPYYLTHKAKAFGYNPKIILAGRQMNDEMPKYVSSQLIKTMIKKKIQVENSKVLIMGFTFKENCPDIRNTKVIDVINELNEYQCKVDIYDPWVNEIEAEKQYKISIISSPEVNRYDAIIIAVSHQQFLDMPAKNIRSFCKKNSVLFDLKHILNADDSDLRL